MNSKPDEHAVDRLAGAVADGSSVDWEREKSLRPDLAPELSCLEALSKIRTLTESSTEEASPVAAPNASSVPGSLAALSGGAGGRTVLFTWGRLLTVEMLGQGTYGEVYRAFDPALQIDVALKLRRLGAAEDPESVETFLAEARRLARVRHINVVRVHGADVHEGRVGIWTELVQGETLEQRLGHGPMGASEALAIGLDICRALAAVHGAGLVHRDVKTTNVMKEHGGRIVLMDFGSGDELPRPGAMAETLRLHGTPLYMPPEQLHGKISGAPMDIYSVGVILYRLVSREFPVQGSSVAELVDRHAEGGPEPLLNRRPDLPPEFLEVVHRALAPRPEERFQSAGEMERAIVAAIGRQKEPQNRRKWLPWVAGIGAALLVVFLMFPFLQARVGKLLPVKKKQTVSSAVTPSALMAAPHIIRHQTSGDEPLLPGARVAVGDLLFMEIQGSSPMHLYVFNEDAKGRLAVLYPLRGLEPVNPLSAGQVHELPGRQAGRRFYWKIDTEGTRESIVAFASKDPIPSLEHEIEGLPHAKIGAPLPVSDEAAVRIRGIGGLVSESEAAVAKPRLADVLNRYAVSAGAGDSARRPWVWQIEFESRAR